MGRYVVGGKVNALLQSIRDEYGVQIEYTDGSAPRTIASGSVMPDFSGAGNPAYPSQYLGYNMIGTVDHNGVISPSFNNSATGSRYTGIEYRDSSVFKEKHPGLDYKVTRLSRLVTDVNAVPCYVGEARDLNGWTYVHCGSGSQKVYDFETGKLVNVAGGYDYNNGGVSTIMVARPVNNWSDANVVSLFLVRPSDNQPLPWLGQGGDSGSSCFVWNPNNQRYEYVGAFEAMSANTPPDQTVGTSNGDGTYHEKVNDKYTTKGNWTGGGDFTVDTGIVKEATVTEGSLSGTPRYSVIKKYGQYEWGRLYRNETGVNTWKDLNPLKDSDTWWRYGSAYLNIGDSATEGVTTMPELYQTRNSSFTLGNGTYTLAFSETLDMGIGYLEFSHNGVYSYGGMLAEVVLKSDESGNGLLNTAGYVVNKNVELHMQMTNPSDYVREWRKIGEGDWYIEGSGDNYALLNVGGTGKTFLNRTDGFAAYNVLANTGSTVVLQDQNQIARDFTFGSGGATLDFNGNSMEWNNGSEVVADGFHIHALTEEAVIANTAATDVTLTVKDAGTSYLGSFVDVEGKGALRIVYDAAGTTWDLHSIHTDLSHNSESSFTVRSGTVSLSGTTTRHGYRSDAATGGVYANADDWHYADSAMDVKVEAGGVFRLGSHARLTGDVSVENGGQFILNEGVKHRMEYVEGGQTLEDTSKYSEFFGLKGNLVNNGSVRVEYSAGTDANNTYAGNISGSGSMAFDLGTDGGVFTMTGANTSTGDFEVVSGGVVAHSLGAGSWKVGEKGFLALQGSGEEAFNRLTADSSGVLALTGDQATVLDIADKRGVIIGALQGKEVHYGTDQTTESLVAYDGKWTLGGGGGNLIVDFRLADKNAELVLGNEWGKGVVTLTNRGNSIGSISFASGVTLESTSVEALGGSMINLTYTNRLDGSAGIESALSEEASGVLLVDRMNAVDVSERATVAIGLKADGVYAGSLTVGEGAAYRFGGFESAMVLETSLEAGHDLILDGQTYSGGVLTLNNGASDLTGSVTVMGYDASRVQTTEGDVTLRVGADGVLDRVADVTVKDGGTLDVAGTTQILHNLTLEAGGVLTDSAEEQGATTVVGDVSLSGVVSLGTLEAVGESTHVSVASASSLAGLTRVRDGATLSLEAFQLARGVSLEGGTLQVKGNISGALSAVGDGNVLSSSAATTVLSGAVQVASGGRLSLQGDVFTLSASAYNNAEGAGAIEAEANRVLLNNGGGTRIGGSVELREGRSLDLYSSGSRDNMLRDIAAVHLAKGSRLNLSAESWNTVWNIHALTGSGDVNWTAGNNHWYSSRLILDGDNSGFTGNINLARTGNTQGTRNYQAFIELAHDQAASGATVSATGAAANRMAAIAVNAAHAEVGGLNSNAYAVLYAGAALVGDSGNGGSNDALKDCFSTSSNELIIKGKGGTWAGVVKNGDDGAGLSLVMDGDDAASQTFSGSSVALNSVTVKNGTLVLNSAALEIAGDIDVQGGSLDLSGGNRMALGGEVTLNGGALRLADGLAAGKGVTARSNSSELAGKLAMNVTVESGATLNLVDATVSSVIQNNGSVGLGENVTFSLSGDALFDSNGSYLVIEGGIGASLSGNIAGSTILVDGKALNTFASGSTLTTEGGSLVLNLASRTMVFAVSGTNSTAYHWDNSGKTMWRPEAGGTLERVCQFDNVIFDGAGFSAYGEEKWVWLDTDQTVKNASLSGSRNAFLSYPSNAETRTWNVKETMTISGEGNRFTVNLNVGDDLVVSGLNTSFGPNVKAGGDILISGDVSFSSGNVTAGGAVRLLGEGGAVNVNSPSAVVFNSHVLSSSEAEWGVKKGRAGSLTFEKDVALKYFTTDSQATTASSVSTFKGETSIDEVTMESGRFVLSESGSLRSSKAAVEAEATMSVAGTAEVDELANRGTVEVAGSLKTGVATIADGASLVARDAQGASAYVVTSAASAAEARIADSLLTRSSIEGGRFERAVIKLSDGAVIEMKDVSLASSSFLTDDAATVLSQGLRVEVDARNCVAGVSTLADGTLLTQTGSDYSLNVSGEAEVYTLTLNNIDSVLISGDALGFVLTDADMKAAALAGGEWVALTLSDSLESEGNILPQALMDASQLKVTLGIDSNSYTGFYEPDSSSNVGTVYFRVRENQIVPEPATSALGLLALVALAARRRRSR